MKSFWRFKYAIVVTVALFVAALGFRMFTFRWEAARVRSATSLALNMPEETLTGDTLQLFLRDFECDNTRQFGWQCTLGLRTGRITINGEDCPIEIIDDKFAGKVLVVHCRWKTVELVRRRS